MGQLEKGGDGPRAGRASRVPAGAMCVAEKPRLLVIERETHPKGSARDHLSDLYEVVTARTMSRALLLLREQEFAAVYVDTAQLSAVRWAGVLIQAEEILDAIADGVAVVDPDLRIIWANPEFHSLTDPSVETIGSKFYRVLGNPEVLGPDPCPFTSAVASQSTATTVLRIGANRYLRITVTPVFDGANILTHIDRADARHHRRDAAAAQGQRDPQGGRRTGRSDP